MPPVPQPGDGGTRPLTLAVGAMLAQQSLVSMGSVAVPVVLPPAAASLGVDPSLVGAYTALLYAVAAVAAMSAGGFILRWGGLRVSQVTLLLIGAGFLVAGLGALPAFVATALLVGAGAGASTPASSHILAKVAPPRLAPLIFSIKQTGVPAGGALAGVLLPFLVARLGWEAALAACLVLAVTLALALQPLRARFDMDREPGRRLSPGQVGATVRLVLRDAGLRDLALACFFFSGLQLSFGSFFVAYLASDLGLPLATAGLVFAAAQTAAIPGRIFWGWVAGRWVAPRLLLGWLGVAMAAATASLATFGPDWPIAAMTALSVLFGLTAISWNGVFLAEIVRQAPPGQAGAVTGGVLFFGFGGLVAMPSLFGILLALTGSYAAGFLATAAPALVLGLTFMRPRRTRPARPAGA